MYYVPPFAGEAFFLCFFLAVIPGPTSFKHLRTIDGVHNEMLRAAYLAANPLDDDSHWDLSFEEAEQTQPHGQEAQ